MPTSQDTKRIRLEEISKGPLAYVEDVTRTLGRAGFVVDDVSIFIDVNGVSHRSNFRDAHGLVRHKGGVFRECFISYHDDVSRHEAYVMISEEELSVRDRKIPNGQ
jgi:hypothetical protein